MFQSCGPYGSAWFCLAPLPGTPIVCGTNTPSPSETRVANAAVGSQTNSRPRAAARVAVSAAPRLLSPLPLPAICKLRAGNVTCAAKTQFRCTDIDLPHKKTVPQTVAQVQIAFQRSARVANSSTQALEGGRGGRGKGLPYQIHTHGRLSRSRCLQCMWSTLGCVVIHSF